MSSRDDARAKGDKAGQMLHREAKADENKREAEKGSPMKKGAKRFEERSRKRRGQSRLAAVGRLSVGLVFGRLHLPCRLRRGGEGLRVLAVETADAYRYGIAGKLDGARNFHRLSVAPPFS